MSKARWDKPRCDAGETGLEARVKALHQEVRALEDEVYGLQLERDILEAAAEVLRDPLAPDLVQRQFEVAAPNSLWVGDITQHPTAEGSLYLAAIRCPPYPVLS